MNLRYLGFKDQLDLPSASVAATEVPYLTHLAHLDGLFSALEDYFDATNPRIQSLFPKLVYNPLPTVKASPILKTDQYLLAFKTYSLSQKLVALSNFSENLLSTWYLDSPSFIDPWNDESYWIFEQDLADVLISLMQNLGDSYSPSSTNSAVILQVLQGAKYSFNDSYQKLLVARGTLVLDTSDKFTYWMKVQDYSLQAYLETIEYLIEFFTYCENKGSLPDINSILSTGY